MSSILFTCVGTSDPIRGRKDGPVLHILRKYRPDEVVLLLTTEMRGWASGDNRFGAVREHMKNAWGYAPIWQEEYLEISDPSDLDLVYEVIYPVLRRHLRNHESDEILVNLSSGTPQMKMLLMDLATDLRYNCLGIQVKNPTNASGATERTNKADYAVEDAIATNEDEAPNYTNRCENPKMLSIKRNNQWEQLLGILELRDFEAAAKMNQLMPVHVERMASHLLHRSRLNNKEAKKYANQLMLKDKLYPIPFRPEDKDIEALCEYYLTLRNMQRSGRSTEFVLRLNPFIVDLQVARIDALLRKNGYTFYFDDLTVEDPDAKRKKFRVAKLQQYAPKLMNTIEQLYKKRLRDGVDKNIILGNMYLDALDAENEEMNFFDDCEYLNTQLRNKAAHELQHFTEKDIRSRLGYGSEELLRQIEELLPAAFTRYSAEQFQKFYGVYDFGIAYIRDNR